MKNKTTDANVSCCSYCALLIKYIQLDSFAFDYFGIEYKTETCFKAQVKLKKWKYNL